MKYLSSLILIISLVMPACTKEVDYSGLKIKDLKKGSGRVVTNSDTVFVYYTGYFTNGRIFDTNKRKTKPKKSSMKSRTLIEGWKGGIPGMKAGGVRRLTIPPHLAFGTKGKGSQIPPNTTVIFEIELVSIED